MPMKIHHESSIKILFEIWLKLSPRRHFQFLILFVLMLLSAFIEIINIGAVLSFLTTISAPNEILNNKSLQSILNYLSISTADQLLLPVTVFFGIATLFTNFIRLLVLVSSARLSAAAGSDLSVEAFNRTLHQPYITHISRNSSDIINGITGKVGSAIGSITSAFNLIGSLIMLIGILVAMVLVDPIVCFFAFGGFGLIYATIIRMMRQRLLENSQRSSVKSNLVIKSIQEALGGIRDVLLDGTQSTYTKIYGEADRLSRRAQANLNIISSSPRYGVEALGILLILVIAYFIASQANGIAKVIPVLGALALASQRLLPVLQSAYSSWTNIQGNQNSLKDALDLLNQPMMQNEPRQHNQQVTFADSIQIKNLSFQYSMDGPQIISQLNWDIKKGKRIGIIGKTGSGKSTLLDILMGLLSATDGKLLVDGVEITERIQRSWQSHIAHVPQAIFLADTTLEENIAFGIPSHLIDHKRVIEVAERAQILELINQMPDKFKTIVGERGVRLSGGSVKELVLLELFIKEPM